MFLGVWFLANQIDETYSATASDSVYELSGVVVVLYVHLSHLCLCLGFFLILTLSLIGDSTSCDSLLDLSVLYWHLVEVVWITILGLLAGV